MTTCIQIDTTMNTQPKSPLVGAGILLAILFLGMPLFSRAADTAPLVAGNTQFALDLYARLKSGDGNLFFSPYSISTCLAMTWAGARGNTASQMAGALHLQGSPALVHSQFADLQKQLNAVQAKKKVALNIANGLWAQKDHPFLPAFFKIATDDYASQIRQADFHTAAEATRLEINNWVSAKTADRIQDLIPPGAVDGDTRLVLVNAIYFKGRWDTPFKKSKTRPAPFKTESGRSVTEPFMHETEWFGYAETNGLQLLELTYAGGDLSMVVLLPAETSSFKEFEDSLTAKNLDLWLRQSRGSKVEVFLPKFRLTEEFSLGDTLAAMGITEAFTSNADFSGMDGGRDLFISAVIHKAFVEVNEEGTEAAAATGAVAVASAVRIEPMDVPVFRADHPFVFLIRDTHSGSILFLGRFAGPEK
jgi:serpin B